MTDLVRAAASRAYFERQRRLRPTSLFGLGFMAAAASLVAPWWLVAAWVAGQLALLLIHQIIARRALVAMTRAATPARWEAITIGFEIVHGIWWGATAFLFVRFDQPISITLTICCVVAVAGDTSSLRALRPRDFLAWAIPVSGLIALRFFLADGTGYLLLGAGSLLVGAAMVATCFDIAVVQRDGLRIRFENREMLEQLRVQRAEAEEARHRAELASLAKSQFLAAASHDLRQPLYALSLFSSSLDALSLDQETRAVVGRIQDSVAVMESLFVGLLDLSKLEAGVIRPELAAVDVAALFDRLSQYFHPVALERGLDLRFRADGEWVTSDAVLLEQTLSNLVSNALRCTAAGGVLVAARRRGRAISLEVWDTGIGIAADDLPRIFEEFVQLDNPERDRRKGLGLGLSIAQRSARLLGTEVTVASRPGRGSRFAVVQPAAAPPAAEETRAIAPPPALPGRAAPVLVVEDNREVRLALGDLLKRWGIGFDAVADADAALARIDAGGRYGLVLSDHRLTGATSGLDLLRAVRARHPLPFPAMALVTGDVDAGLIAAADAAGVQVLLKPVRPDALRTLLGLSGQSPGQERQHAVDPAAARVRPAPATRRCPAAMSDRRR